MRSPLLIGAFSLCRGRHAPPGGRLGAGPHRASRPPAARVHDRHLRRFLADSTPVAAGGRAILLQIADPVVAAGVRRQQPAPPSLRQLELLLPTSRKKSLTPNTLRLQKLPLRMWTQAPA